MTLTTPRLSTWLYLAASLGLIVAYYSAKTTYIVTGRVNVGCGPKAFSVTVEPDPTTRLRHRIYPPTCDRAWSGFSGSAPGKIVVRSFADPVTCLSARSWLCDSATMHVSEIHRNGTLLWQAWW
jgi:hypothetical protein